MQDQPFVCEIFLSHAFAHPKEHKNQTKSKRKQSWVAVIMYSLSCTPIMSSYNNRFIGLRKGGGDSMYAEREWHNARRLSWAGTVDTLNCAKFFSFKFRGSRSASDLSVPHNCFKTSTIYLTGANIAKQTGLSLRTFDFMNKIYSPNTSILI